MTRVFSRFILFQLITSFMGKPMYGEGYNPGYINGHGDQQQGYDLQQSPYNPNPTTQQYAPPPGPPPGGQYAPPPGPPPGGQHAPPPGPFPGDQQYTRSPSPPPGDLQYAPPSDPPPGNLQYAPPSGSPPGNLQYAPPSDPPPEAGVTDQQQRQTMQLQQSDMRDVKQTKKKDGIFGRIKNCCCCFSNKHFDDGNVDENYGNYKPDITQGTSGRPGDFQTTYPPSLLPPRPTQSSSSNYDGGPEHSYNPITQQSGYSYKTYDDQSNQSPAPEGKIAKLKGVFKEISQERKLEKQQQGMDSGFRNEYYTGNNYATELEERRNEERLREEMGLGYRNDPLTQPGYIYDEQYQTPHKEGKLARIKEKFQQYEERRREEREDEQLREEMGSGYGNENSTGDNYNAGDGIGDKFANIEGKASEFQSYAAVGETDADEASKMAKRAGFDGLGGDLEDISKDLGRGGGEMDNIENDLSEFKGDDEIRDQEDDLGDE